MHGVCNAANRRDSTSGPGVHTDGGSMFGGGAPLPFSAKLVKQTGKGFTQGDFEDDTDAVNGEVTIFASVCRSVAAAARCPTRISLSTCCSGVSVWIPRCGGCRCFWPQTRATAPSV